MAVTLLESSKMMTGEVVRPAIIEMFARENDVLRVLPIESIAGNAYRYNREEALPGIAFRAVNEGYSESAGVINPVVESLYICGGDLDVDRFIVATQGQGVRSAHEGLKIKAIAHEWGRVFIKGDSEANPKEFDGLQKRLTGSQLIAARDTTPTSGGDPLSLLKLDELIDAVDSPTHLVMSKAMRRLLAAAARNQNVAGRIDFQPDEFGRRITTYNGLPILCAYASNGGTDPIAFNEAGPGGGTTSTSIYCVSLGDGMLKGIQSAPMSVRDLGELESKPVFRTRVEWYAGIAMEHGRAAARLWGISNAAVAA